MAPPVKKKKKFSSDNRHLNSFTEIGEHEQQSMGSLTTSLGKRRSVRVSMKLNRPLWTKLKRDLLMDSLPFFNHAQLGLKLALVSPRFDAMVDKHFDGQSALTIWRQIRIDKIGTMPKLCVFINYVKSVPFPLPDRPLPNKIRFKNLQIAYIDHFVIAFLRANKQIFDGNGTALKFSIWSAKNDVVPIWDVLARDIWPIFAPNIRHLGLTNADHLDKLRRLISPTILSDLKLLNSINTYRLLPDAIGGDFDQSNATGGQVLSKWLHTPTTNGQPKRLNCVYYHEPAINIDEWINTFKEAFLRATSSACYEIQFAVHATSTSMVPFEEVNKRTNEKLTLIRKACEYGWAIRWVIKRCQIGQMVKWEDTNLDNLDNVSIDLSGDKQNIGPLSPQKEEKESGQIGGKGRRNVLKNCSVCKLPCHTFCGYSGGIENEGFGGKVVCHNCVNEEGNAPIAEGSENDEPESQNKENEGTPAKDNKRHRNNDAVKKVEAVEWAQKNSVNAAAKKFKVDRKVIRDWMAHEDKLRKQIMTPNGGKRMRLGGAGRPVHRPDIDIALAEWITEKRTNKQPVSRNIIRRRAAALFMDTDIKFAMDETAVWFDCPDNRCIEKKGAKDVCFLVCGLTTPFDGIGDEKIACFKPEGAIGPIGTKFLREFRENETVKDGRNDHEEAGLSDDDGDVELDGVGDNDEFFIC
ncbi:hypothetical protein niasHT_013844 [Heterodera trifolii]|uniref:HTH CENPB-type domain-containing protein n=1 Tax=Heterodera trifolii TaxID=157864 RepID=A0ABD2LGH6_9BILA